MKPTKVLAAAVGAEQEARVAEERILTSGFGLSGQAWALCQDQYLRSWAQSQPPAPEAVPAEAGRGAVSLERLNVEPCPAGAVGLRLICV